MINDYSSDIKNISYPVKLDSSEYRKYMYKPKLLCKDLYDTPELYFIILLINDMADVKEFNRSIIYLPPKRIMNELVTYIYNAEKDSIESFNG